MNGDEITQKPWGTLAQAVNNLPEATRQDLLAGLRVFLHDLRQAQGQVKSAADLLRTMLSASPDPDGMTELLDVIRSGNQHGAELLDSFTRDFVERIHVPD